MNIGFGSLIVKEKMPNRRSEHVCGQPGLVLDQGGVEPLCVSRLPVQEAACFQLGRVLGETVRQPDVVAMFFEASGHLGTP